MYFMVFMPIHIYPFRWTQSIMPTASFPFTFYIVVVQMPVLHTQPSLESINNIFIYKKVEKHETEKHPTVPSFCMTFPFISLPDKKNNCFPKRSLIKHKFRTRVAWYYSFSIINELWSGPSVWLSLGPISSHVKWGTLVSEMILTNWIKN